MANAFENLKKAHQAMAIAQADFSLQEYYIANRDKATKAALMTMIGIESKWIPRLKRDDGTRGGYRTCVTLASGETVAAFSMGFRSFFEFFAGIMGYDVNALPNYLNIAVNGKIDVAITKVDLDDNQYTYNFDLVSGDVKGFGEYDPFANLTNQLMLGAPEATDANPENVDGDGSPAAEEAPEVKTEPETVKMTKTRRQPAQ